MTDSTDTQQARTYLKNALFYLKRGELAESQNGFHTNHGRTQ